MHLTGNELKLLRWLDAHGEETFEQQEQGGTQWIVAQIGMTEREFEKAYDHLGASDLIGSIGMIADDGLYRIHITAAGREALRAHDHQRQRRLLWILDKLIFSVIVPILVAGAVAYYVGWLGLKK
jgi:hypothetical protein